jgi:Fe-S-cluster-containing dehydrogenase component
MVKREDGIVYIDHQKCVGCMACAGACFWSIPELNRETKKAVKCDYCMDRVDAGLKPACVTKCTTRALRFVRIQEM